MSNPSFESSPSLTDLFEYDEYDSYENPYAEIDTSDHHTEGIPLSVELSESLSRRQCNDLPHTILASSASTDIDTDANNQFVKAPEIFLRIDNEVPTAAACTTSTNVCTIIKTECDRTADSFESSGSDVSVAPAIDCDIVELHYENEFFDASGDECDDVGPSTSCLRSATQFENDNEQLLFEGTSNTY